MDGKKIEALQHIISESEYIVFFGGGRGLHGKRASPISAAWTGFLPLFLPVSARDHPEPGVFFQRSTEEFYRFTGKR